MAQPAKEYCMLTQERLLSLVYYGQLTGVFTRKHKLKPSHIIGEVLGKVNKDGYLVMSLAGKAYLAHRLVFLYVLGEFPPEQVDHIDHNRTNNSFMNLRLCSHKQNCYNKSSNNRLGKGISFVPRKRHYQASLMLDYKVYSKCFSLKSYNNSHEEALQAARTWVTEKRLELHGEFHGLRLIN